MRYTRGISAVEVLIVIAILGVLATIAVSSYSGARQSRIHAGAVDALVAALESAHADAVAGVGGEARGVKFNSDSYVRFSGNYSAGDPDNAVTELNDALVLTTTLADADAALTFARVDGAASETATITIQLAEDAGVSADIVVGPRGDISVAD